MPFSIFNKTWAFRELERALGIHGLCFLEHALNSITTLLPHIETDRWTTYKTPKPTRIQWISNTRIEIGLTLKLVVGGTSFRLTSTMRRRRRMDGAGAIARALDQREHDLCRHILERAGAVLCAPRDDQPSSNYSLRAIQGLFLEQVVGSYLQEHHKIQIDVGDLFSQLRELAEQSYENKSITFGLLVRGQSSVERPEFLFPADFFEKKRYRALSDGYRTAFEIDRRGKLLGLVDLQLNRSNTTGNHFYPEWCRDMAKASEGTTCGVSLTRQGDILVFDGGSLRFSYRAGRWQYWNHTHAINIFRNRVRVQHVPTHIVSAVVNKVYRIALDVSFRRSGCLFALLRNQGNLSKLVVPGDAINDMDREEIYGLFDATFGTPTIQSLSNTLRMASATAPFATRWRPS